MQAAAQISLKLARFKTSPLHFSQSHEAMVLWWTNGYVILFYDILWYFILFYDMVFLAMGLGPVSFELNIIKKIIIKYSNLSIETLIRAPLNRSPEMKKDFFGVFFCAEKTCCVKVGKVLACKKHGTRKNMCSLCVQVFLCHFFGKNLCGKVCVCAFIIFLCAPKHFCTKHRCVCFFFV